MFDVVDLVEEVDDADSIVAIHGLQRILHRRWGGSSGSNWVACLRLADRMRTAGVGGSIVTLLCDEGDRYADTLYSKQWLLDHGFTWPVD